MRQDQVQLYFFLFLFLGTIALAVLMFLPFFSVIAVAAVFATLFEPMYRYCLRNLGERKNLAATITVLTALAMVFVPITVFSFLLFQEARDVYMRINENGLGQFTEPVQVLEAQVKRLLPGVEFDIRSYLGQATRWVAHEVGGLFAGTAGAVLRFFLGIIAFYYLLRDGKDMLAVIRSYSPLDDAHDNQIFDRVNATVHAVVKGSLSIAVVQGILTSIGLVIFGVPNPVLWGGFAAIAALIPALGTAVIFVPAVLYLVFVGHVPQAIGLIVWGATAVGLIDNVLMPKLVGRGVAVHPVLIIFSVFGGLAFFGPLGFFLGPLVMSMLLVLGHIYSTLVKTAA